MGSVCAVLFWLCLVSVAANIVNGLFERASAPKSSTPWRLSQTEHEAAMRGIGYVIACAVLAIACKP